MIQKIIDIISEKPVSYEEIMRLLDIKKVKVLEKYLEDIEKICKRKGWKLEIVPAECKKCGFVFQKSVKIPSKCPKCKSYWISKPKFFIRK